MQNVFANINLISIFAKTFLLVTHIMNKPLITCMILFSSILSYAQIPTQTDFRNRQYGNDIHSNEYIDQPYVVILDNGEWLCVFTTSNKTEGKTGQHIACARSSDFGKSWSKPINIEEAGEESSSWAMPYKTVFGRIYVFYDFNGDKIHSLPGDNPSSEFREDMLGWYCFRYSDDNGENWSQRYRLPVRSTSIDTNNDWKGKVQMLWGIGKPIDTSKGMMFGFSKIGKYILDNSEGWFFRCKNINREKDPEKLKWEMLPKGDKGLRNDEYGPIQSEHNLVEMSNGTLYSVFRTITGSPLCAYSKNHGKTWSTPMPPQYYTGRKVKNPRACPRIFRISDGKYLLWHHNNGGVDFGNHPKLYNRNPAWISAGIEKNGEIIWSQPEILLYMPADERGMSYPDLIIDRNRYWITETEKRSAKCHEIPSEFIEHIFGQFYSDVEPKDSLIAKYDNEVLNGREMTFEIPLFPMSSGFTLYFEIETTRFEPGIIYMDSRDNSGKGIWIENGENLSVKFSFCDGKRTVSWTSDPYAIKPYGKSQISITVDYNAELIYFVTNGEFNDGGEARMFGWTRYDNTINDFNTGKLKINDIYIRQRHPVKNEISSLRIYGKPLSTTENVCLHRYRLKKQL